MSGRGSSLAGRRAECIPTGEGAGEGRGVETGREHLWSRCEKLRPIWPGAAGSRLPVVSGQPPPPSFPLPLPLTLPPGRSRSSAKPIKLCKYRFICRTYLLHTHCPSFFQGAAAIRSIHRNADYSGQWVKKKSRKLITTINQRGL